MALELTQEQKDAGWQAKKLSECFDIIGGGTPKTSIGEYWGGEIPWLSVTDFSGSGRTVNEAEKSITQLGLDNSSAKVLEGGDLIISARGTVGELAQLGRPMAFNQSCYGLRGTSGVLTNDYGFYLMKTVVSVLRQQSHGSVFSTITRGTFESIEVVIPPVIEQKRVAEILGSVDDKIEANSSLLNSLSELGSALMRREISASTTTAPLSEIAEITMGQSPAGDSLNEDGEGAIFYQGRRDFGFRYPTQRVYTIAPTRMADEGDILLSVRAPVGDLNRTDRACCVGRGVAAIRAKDGNTSQLFYLLKESPQLWESFEGEGTIFSSINRKQLHELSVPLISPSTEYENIEENIKKLTKENRFLVSTRDLLIQKMMY